MDIQQPIEPANEAVINPHSYLFSISAYDSRWNRFKQFWQLESMDPNLFLKRPLRKLRPKQVLIAILNGRYCKKNLEITVDYTQRIIMFYYRGTLIGRFDQKIMTFMPVHADSYEGTSSTIEQRKNAKSAMVEIVQILLGDSAADRISLAYKEFLMLLFGTVPRQPSDFWVSREAYIHAMNVIEEKYKLESGDTDFLEWRLTLLGRSPMISDDPKEMI